MIRLLYSIAYMLALPLVLPGQYLKRHTNIRPLWLDQKRGIFLPRTDSSPLLWIHAVSVGEVIAATTFINAFTQRHPDYKIIVSTITDTGQAVARERLAHSVQVIYLPFDLTVYLKRAIKALRPSVFVVMETEIWPNLFHCMHEASVPVALLNGRISEKSFSSYRKIRRVLSRVLKDVDVFAMQDDVYAERIIEMGAEPSRVHRTGSFKFDIELEKKELAWKHVLKQGLTIVAGSTHKGEDEIICRAFVALQQTHDLSMILVPRHPQRAAEVLAALRSFGLSCVLRSSLNEGHDISQKVDVVLVDTVGELTSIYSEADIAIMGGSFIPHGGQNPLEPAYWGKPVVCGPYMFNFPFMPEFYSEEAAVETTEQNLQDTLLDLIESADKRSRLGERASAILHRNRGALARTLDIVDSLLSEVK